MSFDDYVKAHKDEASKWFQKQFNRRHADYNQLKSRADASAQVLDVLAAKYNLDANDVDGIVKALNGDDSMFEERAIEAGMTVEQYKRFSEAQAENRRLRAEQQQFQQTQQIQRQMEEWDRQSNNLKQIFPDFDLDAELKNPDFEKALRSASPLTVPFMRCMVLKSHPERCSTPHSRSARQQLKILPHGETVRLRMDYLQWHPRR